MNILFNRALFTPWTDPVSGITSHILTTRVAPFQQSFYFTHPSFSGDGRFYWFYCAFPPSGDSRAGRTLAVLDLHGGTLRHFPDTQFLEASPMIDLLTGEAYWSNETGIWKRSPLAGGEAVMVNRFPDEFVGNRKVWRYATHHTLSADRKALNIDAEVGDRWYVGHAPLDGSPIIVWSELDRNYNHAQFSPSAPDLQLIAQDYYVDRRTWEQHRYDNRLWLIRRGEVARPVFASNTTTDYTGRMENAHFKADVPCRVNDPRAMHGHEWWSADGRSIWYVHYGRGVERVRTGMEIPELLWEHRSVTHAHSSADDMLLVCDSLPPTDPKDRRVAFKDLRSGRSVDIVSFMEDLPAAMIRQYHIHPHPQFCLGDRLICYTTTVLGRADVAFVRVEDILSRTT